MPVIFIADNGSAKPDATKQLRDLASQLSDKSGHKIYPVSLQHAQRIPAEKLDGKPAQILFDFLSQKLTEGYRDFLLLPMFFGKSKALTSFVPEQVDLLKAQFGDFTLEIAKVIYPLPDGEPLLVNIIYDHILKTASNNQLQIENIVLVDHGSPVAKVTEVRKNLASLVQQKLPSGVTLEQAVMERRPGKEYDFNGDLLQNWLNEKAESGATGAIVILQFFLAGRHAGEGGDIVKICQQIMQAYPQFKVAISPLIADHPALLEILHNRLLASFCERSTAESRLNSTRLD